MAALLLASLASCGPSAPPETAPEPSRPAGGEPVVRVGVAVDVDSVRISSPAGLVVRPGGPGTPTLETGAYEVVTVRVSGSGLSAPGRLSGGGAAPVRLRLTPRDREAPVRLGGASYRGSLEVMRVPGHGLSVANELALETYLRGVVPLEIGPREPDEREAVKAQAVAARTYALRNLGRRDSLGFDVFGTVEDQVYGGVEVEREEVSRAVRRTRGQVLTYRGQPIRAYYHSTGGGHTARVGDVWNLPDAPYLRRVSDRRPDGTDFCSISPRYRWEERWTPEELRTTVASGLAAYFGVTDLDVRRVASVRVRHRTEHGRVTRLEIRTDAGQWIVTRNDIRSFLRTPDDRVLRSTRFRVRTGPGEQGGLHLTGRGYGHGVGMCQWGAIGRARAGHDYREILSTYYPGTRLVGAY